MEMMSPVRAYAMPAMAALLPGLSRKAKGDPQEDGAATPARRVDGKAVDQAVAYVLMVAALIVTYALH